MTYVELLGYYHSLKEASEALAISPQGINVWRRRGIPFGMQCWIQIRTAGRLQADVGLLDSGRRRPNATPKAPPRVITTGSLPKRIVAKPQQVLTAAPEPVQAGATAPAPPIDQGQQPVGAILAGATAPPADPDNLTAAERARVQPGFWRE